MFGVFNSTLNGTFNNQKEFEDVFFNSPFSGPLFGPVKSSACSEGERLLDNNIEDELIKDFKDAGSRSGLFILRNF